MTREEVKEILDKGLDESLNDKGLLPIVINKNVGLCISDYKILSSKFVLLFWFDDLSKTINIDKIKTLEIGYSWEE